MTLGEAQAIVERLREDGGEYFDLGEFRNEAACLDGNFTADQLEAFAIVMRARPE